MQPAALVILRHETRGGSHFDLMIEANPADPRSDLATWRLPLASADWRPGRLIPLLRLPDHRRAYLRREGRLTGGRGWVRRVDQGVAVLRAWHRTGGVMDLRLGHYTGPARLTHIAGQRFSLHLLPRPRR